ncbi:tripartite tricarboxylate transporter substrate binding protein [Siccirubricoccus deserti]
MTAIARGTSNDRKHYDRRLDATATCVARGHRPARPAGADAGPGDALPGSADRDHRRLYRRRRHRPRRAQLCPGTGTAPRRHRRRQQPPRCGGELALGVVARARPDGHTIGFTNFPGILTIPIERQAQFKLADFAPLANIVTDPSAITTHVDSPYRTLGDVIEKAKAAPGTITYASPGVGTDDHMQLVLLEQAAGIRLSHVVYQGDPGLRTALLGRQVDLIGLNLGAVTAAPEKMRLIAQGGATRSRFQPEVPTLKELGFPVEMASERGLVLPAGTPPAILARLREATADIARDPDFIRQVEGRFTVPLYEEGAAWFDRLRREEARFREIWQRTPWKEQ